MPSAKKSRLWTADISLIVISVAQLWDCVTDPVLMRRSSSIVILLCGMTRLYEHPQGLSQSTWSSNVETNTDAVIPQNTQRTIFIPFDPANSDREEPIYNQPPSHKAPQSSRSAVSEGLPRTKDATNLDGIYAWPPRQNG